MTEKEKTAVADRLAATVKMMMGEQSHGYWTLEDYEHVFTFAWVDTGDEYACDLTVANDSGSKTVNGSVEPAEDQISAFVHTAL